jgi:Spy/CpxP family protein refolding chaperone
MLLCGQAAFAQQQLIELARQDIRAGRVGMIAGSMELTPAQQEKFWPIYREYADEQEQLLDQRIAMLQKFAGSLDNMTDAAAVAVAEQSFAIQRSRLERRERYFKRFSEVLGPVLAARFIQVDSQMSTLLDFEMARNTPLIQVQAPVEGQQ